MTKLVPAAATAPYSATAPVSPIASQAAHSRGIYAGNAYVNSGVKNSLVSGSKKNDSSSKTTYNESSPPYCDTSSAFAKNT